MRAPKRSRGFRKRHAAEGEYGAWLLVDVLVWGAILVGGIIGLVFGLW